MVVTAPGARSADPAAAPWLRAGALYAALTLVYAWPLLGSLTAALPHDSGDPGLNAWILWWNAHAVPLTERWWNAPIFFPARGAFALSETMLSISVFTTPLLLAGVNAVTAYNVAFLVSFPATALSSHALAFRLTRRHDAALLAGLAFGFSPYRASQMPHLQMLWAMWMPLCLLALHRYLDTRRLRDLLLAAACWVMNGLTSGYFLAYFAVLLGLWVLWFARSRRDWLAMGLAFGLSSLILMPVLVGYTARQSSLGLARHAEEISNFSADLTGFWAVSTDLWLPKHWTFEPRAEGELYPGATILVVTIIGAVVAWRRARVAQRRRLQIALLTLGVALGVAAVSMPSGGWKWPLFGFEISLTRVSKGVFTAACLIAIATVIDRRVIAGWRNRSRLVFYVVAALVMMVFALGPSGRAHGTIFMYQAPYSWLMELPGGHALRVPARFAMLFILCLTQAAALAFSRLTPGGAGRPVLVALSLAVLAEGWMPAFPIASLSPTPALVGKTSSQSAIVELPIQDVFTDTAAMLRATVHGHPLINGFSGYEPAHYTPMREAFIAEDPSVLTALRQFGPITVVVDRARDPAEEITRFVRDASGASFLFRSPLGAVFQFPAVTAPPRALGLSPLPIAWVDSNDNFGAVAKMLDGDLNTSWQSEAPQSAGIEIVMAFAQPVRLQRVEMDLADLTLNYPRKLTLQVADGGRPPVVLWEGRTAGAAVLGALADPKRVPVAVELPEPVPGRRFLLTTQEREPVFYWSIAELRAFGRPQ